MTRYWNVVGMFSVAAIALCGSSANAALVLCADSIAGIEFSLAVAENDGQDDDIRIVSGSYPLIAPLEFVSHEGRALAISGGWNGNCTAHTTMATVLDGQGQVKPLKINQNSLSALGTVRVQGITFIDGLAVVGSYGGALWIVASANVTVDLNWFVLNRADASAGALYLGTSGIIRLRNNLFFGNSANHVGSAWLDTNNVSAFVTSNTFVGNTADAVGDNGGLYVLGNAGARFTISNNILWNNRRNSGVDMRIENVHALLYNNDIGVWSGPSAASGSQGNLSVDPLFAACSGFFCLNFDLASGSPLVNAGRDLPLGQLTARDLSSGPRIVGTHVDIGAYERDAAN